MHGLERAPVYGHCDADEHPTHKVNADDHSYCKLEPLFKGHTGHGTNCHKRAHGGDADVGDAVAYLEGEDGGLFGHAYKITNGEHNWHGCRRLTAARGDKEVYDSMNHGHKERAEDGGQIHKRCGQGIYDGVHYVPLGEHNGDGVCDAHAHCAEHHILCALNFLAELLLILLFRINPRPSTCVFVAFGRLQVDYSGQLNISQLQNERL